MHISRASKPDGSWVPLQSTAFLIIVLIGHIGEPSTLFATDYFLTIGGGYRPSGNQATLEANVIFFQQVLQEKHHGPRVHEVYFADGFDSGADLQILSSATQPKLPATELLASLHRRGGQHVEYRDHQVPSISGANAPALIRGCLSRVAKSAGAGDRLIVYVTAHGGAAQRRDPYNTAISCWGDKSITVRELTGWLAELPRNVPVVMVMAQCYCGGFARSIFEDIEGSHGLAKQLRAGFFAQQHDLAAAGCRPDLDNDEEFSSYFWGAMVGRSRTGEPMAGCDADADGTVSFDEAYAHTMVASETIDIPLKASDVLLRTYSRIPGYKLHDEPRRRRGRNNQTERQGDDANLTERESSPPAETDIERPELHFLSGSLESLLTAERPATRRIVSEISSQLGFSPRDDVTAVVTAYNEHLDQSRSAGRGSRRRSRSGRRDLLAEVAEKWPDLADRGQWENSPLLRAENQDLLLAELKQLPSFEAYSQRRDERARLAQQAEQAELREVKFRRLIGTLEAIVLARNLPLVAAPDIVQRFQEMIALEESSLAPPK